MALLPSTAIFGKHLFRQIEAAFRSARVTMAPLSPCKPSTKSASQSPIRSRASTTAGRCSIDMSRIRVDTASLLPRPLTAAPLACWPQMGIQITTWLSLVSGYILVNRIRG